MVIVCLCANNVDHAILRRESRRAIRSELIYRMYLTAYVNTLIASGRLNTTIVSPIMTSLTELQKCMTDLDKIASTPIPSAYSFHLRLTVWAYLLFLPFQIYPLLGWNTIPAVAIAAITYLGFLEIGCQIEMPFVSLYCPWHLAIVRIIDVQVVKVDWELRRVKAD